MTVTSPLRLTRRSALAGLALLPACNSAVTTSGIPVAQAPPRFDNIDALFARYVAERKIAGAAAAVKAPQAAVIYTQAGSLAFDAPSPAGADSLYRIYSMTKPVTGFAAMLCIEDGRLELDQPIADFIPEFRAMRVLEANGATRAATTQITARHLLTHTAGFGYHFFDTPLARMYRDAGVTPGGRATNVFGDPGRPLPDTLDEFAVRLAALPLEFDPGARWYYSVSLDLLALVIQRAAGMPYEEFLQRRLFAPLRMVDTAFFVPPEKLDRLTSNYGVREGNVRLIDDRAHSPFANPQGMPCGGAGLVSTARDYGRFCEMLLNEGALAGVRVAARETVRQARSNLLPETVDTTADSFRDSFMYGAHFGAGVGVTTERNAKPGEDPPGAFGWGGAAGTIAWVDPANNAYGVFMTQYMPTSAYPVRDEFRQAFYRDLAAIPRGPRTPVDMLSRPRRNF